MRERKIVFSIIALFLIVSILSINLVSSQFGFDDSNLPRVTRDAPAVITFKNDTGSVNSSDFWDGLNEFNTTQMEDNGGVLNILVSWLNSFLLENTGDNMEGDYFITSGNGFVVGHTAQIDFGATPEFQVVGTSTPSSSMGFARFEDNAAGGDFRFLKSRGATIGTNTLPQSGDTIGRIRFQIADEIDFNTPAVQIHAIVDGTPGGNDAPGALIFSTTADGASSVTERMRIDSSGNLTFDTDTFFVDSVNNRVGIGTTNPSFPLDVVGIGRFTGTLFAPSIRVTSVDDFVSTANSGINFGGASKFINFETDAIERMRIISDGKVGINTTSPEELLNVFGTDVSIMAEGDGVTRAGFKIKTNNVLRWDINSPSAQTRLAFMNSSLSEIFSILQSGSVGIGTNDPDGLLNVFSGSAGTVTARPGGDDLVIENSGGAGMSILTPNSSTSTIIFGSPADPLGADIRWNHDNDVFIIGSRKTDATLRFLSGGGVTALNINKNQNFDFQDGNLLTTGTLGAGATIITGDLDVDGTTNSTTGFIVGASVGVTANYSVGLCWIAFSGGIAYSSNCTTF